MRIFERINNFRKIMIKENIDYYIIPSEDAHQGEYVPNYYKGRVYMSGFTGSAGTLLIGRKKAILWTDGRYFIQAQKQLEGSGIELYKMRTEGYGTGHGVGFFLSVHEGPQGINRVSTLSLEKGMVLTNEPRIYKEEKHGIRTENTMIVEEFMQSKEFGEFYKFRTISYCPIDLEGLDLNIMTSVEKVQLNEYHKIVNEKLSKYIVENNLEDKTELLDFLEISTKVI